MYYNLLNGRTAEDFNEFKSLFYKNKSEIYGTHDWIADRAINILNDHFPNDHLVNSIFSNFDNMKVFYLYGTEFPDRLINPFKNVEIKTNYGTKLTKKDFYKGHSVEMLSKGCISKNNNLLFKSAESIEKAFIKNVNSKDDFQVSALYLGYISHLIGDACFVHHIYKAPDDSIGQQAKGEILSRTRNTPEDILWPYSMSIRNYELAKNEFNGHSLSIKKTLFYCIWHTYFGTPHNSGAFQKTFIQNWKWYSTIKIKEVNKKRDSIVYREWWRGIEVHLNLAIFYTATAINHLRNLLNKI